LLPVDPGYLAWVLLSVNAIFCVDAAPNISAVYAILCVNTPFYVLAIDRIAGMNISLDIAASYLGITR